MRSGSPAFGTPEYIRSPFPVANLLDSMVFPIEAANQCFEYSGCPSCIRKLNVIVGNCHEPCNLVNHAAGWLESGLTASFEKFYRC
ncbi:MAG: hypothetical protein Ct9H300mP4_00880 [Gammaproteobacteria bacterium]|nr:MAG: hypothetical protein Ct9H300mP4_00880 [Gammaproteobacteria bacterium]